MPSGSYGSLVFQKADIAKEAITNEAKLKISRLYTEWANDIGKKAEYYKNKTTKSSWLQEMNMRQLQAQLQEQSLQIANEVKGIVEDSIYKVADSVVQANSSWLKDLGFPANGVDSAFVSIPDQTVRRLVTGQIYDTGWSLSKSIWGDNEKTLSKLYEIVAQGLAQNMSVYDVSKILEAYVNPSRAKQWNLMMPDGTRIYKRSVDYNAQRLARTLAQHGYQTSFIAVTEKNPFVTDYIWRANGSRVCELCMQRDGMHFKKDELPLDHPNGMCTMEPNVNDDKMVDQLADWINSPDGTYPEIDEFAKQFGYVPLVKESVKENQPVNAIPVNAHHIVQGKDISNTWERRPNKFDFEIEDVINAQGFDGLPIVLSGDEFNNAVKDAKYHGYRGYSAPDEQTLSEYRRQLTEGKWYVDCSVGTAAYGQGMYTQGCVDNNNMSLLISKAIADGYGQSRSGSNYRVDEVLMSKDAKGVALYKHSGDLTSIDNYSDFHMDYIKKNASGEWNDIGVYAAAKGYDYMYFYDDSGTQECVILNRTKLIIKGD